MSINNVMVFTYIREFEFINSKTLYINLLYRPLKPGSISIEFHSYFSFNRGGFHLPIAVLWVVRSKSIVFYFGGRVFLKKGYYLSINFAEFCYLCWAGSAKVSYGTEMNRLCQYRVKCNLWGFFNARSQTCFG